MCILAKTGEVWSWGAGDCGQLGTGRCTNKEVPSIVTMPCACKMVEVACGAAHVVAVSADLSVYAWGMNMRGQLGLKDRKTRQKPCLIADAVLEKVFADGNSSAGIDHKGRLFTWGSGTNYRLMQSSTTSHDEQRDDGHKDELYRVNAFDGMIVAGFAFSRIGSAVLVVTRIFEVRSYETIFVFVG